MLARALSATPWGVDAAAVQVEVDVRGGLPQTHLVGLPDTAVRESRERVRSAIKNCGFDLPHRTVIINLAPADLRKEGNGVDLAIALAMLAAFGKIPADRLARCLVCGELGLDGTVRPVRGALAVTALASDLGVAEVLLPRENAAEGAALESVPVRSTPGLADAVEHLVGARELSLAAPTSVTAAPTPPPGFGFEDVRGQESAKRALIIAAAGGHNVLLSGPPGSGKTMLARAVPGILPPLERREAIEVTKIHSASRSRFHEGLAAERPFRAPHASTSTAGMIGGGSLARPGEVSLAHAGVLFLDELPEFRRETLEALRQPLEDGEVSIVRARARFTYPARFTLIAAMNPCPCGNLGNPRSECCCSDHAVDRYRSRISGPLLDRIDLHVEVPSPALRDLDRPGSDSSESLQRRVVAARRRQRLRSEGSTCNAVLSPAEVERHCRLTGDARELLERAYERLGLSVRCLSRLRKVARTIADLEQSPSIEPEHLAEALQYRGLADPVGATGP